MLNPALLVAVAVDAGQTSGVQNAIGYAMVALMLGLGVVILYKIMRGTIDISQLLEESGGGASMSRFQLLIFTFVIAFSLFMIVAAKPSSFPEIPNSVIMLLGISGSTYAVAKGIHMGNRDGSSSDSDKTEQGGDTHGD